MIRALIADDEPATAELVREALESTDRVEVVATVADGLACLQTFERTRPDALFLDIRMSQLNGIEVAESVMQADDPPLIAFITNFDEYAVRAFELEAVDYVLKIDDLATFEKRIAETVSRMETGLNRKRPVLAEMKKLVAQLAQQQLHPLQRKLPIRDAEAGTVRLLDPETVLCILRKQRRAILYTRESAYPTYYTMDSLEERLSPEGFFRANPGALFNIRYVEHLIPNGDGSYDVLLKPESARQGTDHDLALRTPITVSRSRAKKLLEALQM